MPQLFKLQINTRCQYCSFLDVSLLQENAEDDDFQLPSFSFRITAEVRQ